MYSRVVTTYLKRGDKCHPMLYEKIYHPWKKREWGKRKIWGHDKTIPFRNIERVPTHVELKVSSNGSGLTICLILLRAIVLQKLPLICKSHCRKWSIRIHIIRVSFSTSKFQVLLSTFESFKVLLNIWLLMNSTVHDHIVIWIAY